MAICKDTIALLLREFSPYLGGDRCLSIGVQRVGMTYNSLRAQLLEAGWPTPAIPAEEIPAPLPQFGPSTHPDVLFRLLGFRRPESVDIRPDDHPTHVHDLNDPIPPALHGRYDLVYDGGSLEHLFDVRQAMDNMVMALGDGGVIIHNVPMNHQVNHGFYQFSPTLFFDYYLTNGFDSPLLFVTYISQGGFFAYRIKPGDPVPLQGPGDRSMVLFAARKRLRVEPLRSPMQRHYAPDFYRILESLPRLQGRQAVVWGTGSYYRDNVSPILGMLGDQIRVEALVDSSPARQGSLMDGLPVLAPAELAGRGPLAVIIASTFRAEITAAIQALGLPDVLVV